MDRRGLDEYWVRRGVAGAILGLAPAMATAATLSFRGPDGASEIDMLVCETVTMEIVLELEEGEVFGFAVIFPAVTISDGPSNMIEVVNFYREDGVLTEATYDRSGIDGDGDPPYPNGQGVGFGVGGNYGLNMGNASLIGPATVVLDNIDVHANALGRAELYFQADNFLTGIYDDGFIQYSILPAGVAPISGALTLGTGDVRPGGAGPVVFNVVEEVPPAVIINDNGSQVGNDNSSGNDNRSSGGGGGTPMCGLGMVPGMLVGLLGLLLLGRLL